MFRAAVRPQSVGQAWAMDRGATNCRATLCLIPHNGRQA
jgi:hypothetical protein